MARAVIAAGQTIKVLAVLLGIIILADGGLILAMQHLGNDTYVYAGGAVALLLISLILGLPLYILGILTHALGQILLANLDIAVNTSVFLSADQKASAMRIK